MRCFLLTALLAVGSVVRANAYDTLRVSLEEAEARFIKNNLLLLAGQYNVEEQTTLVIQARLWSNPRVSAELNAYNPERDKYFDAGKQGEKTFAIEQLIYLGGKKKNEVALARQQAQLASLELEDLLRNLKFQLRKSFYSIYYDAITVERYGHQLELLSSIISAYDEQSKKGNIPLKEVLRLKALYYQLNSDRTELLNDIITEEGNLRLLMNEEGFISPQISVDSFNLYNLQGLSEENLVHQALESRHDYRMSLGAVQLSELNYRFQRSMAVPDLTLGGAYDQRGGAFQNQLGLTLAMDLPVINRNQGNVRAAKYHMLIGQMQRDNKKLEVTNEVRASLERLSQIEAQYNNIDESFINDFESLNEGVIRNFQKRNITLLEFADFFESYNETMRELNSLEKTRMEAYEQLNVVVGTELFK